MIWVAQAISAPTTNLGDYALGVFGPFALVLFILVAIIIYLLRDRKQLQLKIDNQQAENKALLESRVEDAKDFAKLDGQPNEDLKQFIRVLYDAYVRPLGRNQQRRD